MFCFLEKIELATTTCPVRCMYRGKDKTCEYKTLTPDSDDAGLVVHVTAKTISEVKGIKLYKVKELVSNAKVRINIGLTILRYAEFLKTRVEGSILEEQRECLRYREKKGQLEEHEKVEELLLQEFGLNIEAQQAFFDERIFRNWADETDVTVEFSAIIDALVRAANLRHAPQDQETDQSPSDNATETRKAQHV